MNDSKRELRRTMSLTDIKTSSLIRDVVELDLTVPADRSKHRFFLNLPKHDFILPSLTRFDQDFRKFLLSDLLDFALLKDLEEARCLNWCPALRKFLPLLTMADGNCLMNAASLSMWAINDRRLTLRKSVYQVLIEDQTDTFKCRWQLEHGKLLEDQHGGPVDCSEEEWLQDWKNTVKLASTNKLADTQCLSGLEEIHVFALSNVLRRPIIVLCDDILRGNQDESLASVNMGGIYLPLLSDSVDCVKSPIVIGYNQGHFTALVTTEDGSTDVVGEEVVLRERSKNAVPLVKNNGAAMKIHFLISEESQHSDRLLREYLNCSKVEYVHNGGNETALVAVIHSQEPEAHLDQMVKTYFDALQAVYLEKLTEKMSLSGGRLASSAVVSGRPELGGRPRQDTASRWGMATHFSGPSVPPPVASNVQCCSAHQKCKTIGCENYTTHGHGLCHRCKGAEKQVCTSPGCGFKANPDNQDLCSICFARYHAILEQGNSTGRPSAPPFNNECRIENCQQQANPNLHNLCLNCYLKTIHQNFNAEQSANREISTQPATAEPSLLNREPSKQHEISSQRTISPPPTAAPVRRFSRQVSLFCSNPKCHNHLEDSGNEFCDNCVEKMASDIPSESNTRRCSFPGCSSVIQPGNPAAICTSCLSELQATNSSLETNIGSTSMFSVCHVSGCAMPAVTYHGELCLAHYKQSQRHHHGYNVARNDNHSHDPAQEMREAQGTRCITHGCKYFGNPENNYLCSHCHPKALQEQYDMELIKKEQDRAHREWDARNEMSALWSSSNRTSQFPFPDYQQQQFDTRAGYSPRKPFYIQASSSTYQRQTSNSAPPSPNPRRRWPAVSYPCSTEGCPHFGTDQQKGLCNVCFRSVYSNQTGRSRFCSTP